MPAIYDHRITVDAGDIDRQGHANNLAYLKWMQDAAIAHSSLQGWTTERYEHEGVGWVVRTHFVTYRKPAFEGDDVIVRTWVANMLKATSLRKYRIIDESTGDVLADAETDWAFMGMKHRVPRRIPAELRDDFIVSDGPDEA